MSSLPRRVLACGGLLALLLGLGATSTQAAQSRPAPARTGTILVEPWSEGTLPGQPPVITVFASCVRWAAPGVTEAVFGYESSADRSILVDLGPLNDVHVTPRRTLGSHPPSAQGPSTDSQATTIEPPGGEAVATPLSDPATQARHKRSRPPTSQPVQSQPTLILPDRREPYVFAIRYPTGLGAAWQIASPSPAGLDASPDWRVTATTRRAPRCGSDVPDHFSVVQSAGVFGLEKRNEVWQTDTAIPHLTGYDIGIAGADDDAIACSPGGVPMPSTRWFAWPASDVNLLPLNDPDARDVVIEGRAFQMSTVDARPVADVTQPTGWTGPYVDVIGRCAFADGATATSLPFWVDSTTNWDFQPMFDDPSDPTAVTWIRVLAVSPGGVRIR
ncbi:MAG: hypothetical protein ACK5MT_07200 [Actinomycetales bacterium]